MSENQPLAPVIPFRPPASAPQPRGRHGMTARPQTKYTPQDWGVWGRLGGSIDYRIVEVTAWSPAWQADIRSGDWVLSIDGIGFDLFERRGAPADTTVTALTFRPELGMRSIQIVLAAPVRPKPAGRPRKPKYPQIPCGEHLAPKQRLMWQTAMQDDAALIARDRDVAARLATRYADAGNRAWPSMKKLADDLRVSPRTIERAVRVLQHRGWLKIMSGRRSGAVNNYWLIWPVGRSP